MNKKLMKIIILNALGLGFLILLAYTISVAGLMILLITNWVSSYFTKIPMFITSDTVNIILNTGAFITIVIIYSADDIQAYIKRRKAGNYTPHVPNKKLKINSDEGVLMFKRIMHTLCLEVDEINDNRICLRNQEGFKFGDNLYYDYVMIENDATVYEGTQTILNTFSDNYKKKTKAIQSQTQPINRLKD